ncbi:PqiA/YebS family transporter subunit [Desulfosediminicola sp.]|uniref:PqiA/YebS family transporter subunit n=1 Tax=Desulfosediminicola sp. TaxID=2886825 RepID=UPI003AF2CA07
MISSPTPNVSACPQCDILLQHHETPDHHASVCPRCGFVMRNNRPGTVDKVLALSITGLLVYLPAILLPLITLEKLGMSDKANVVDTVLQFFANEYYFVSFMTLVSTIVFPLMLLLLTFIISLQLKRNHPSKMLARLFRAYCHLEEWAMVEVFLLAILISIFKMIHTANIVFNAGLFCFIALVFVTFGICVVLDKVRYWELLDPTETAPATLLVKENQRLDKQPELTAAQAGFALCLTCHKLLPTTNRSTEFSGQCSRCGEKVHLRKPGAMSRTLALVITSTLLLLPANLLPIMQVDFLGVPDRSTILDGILYFLKTGSYLIGIIIMVASIFVPLFKVVGLSILLCSAHFGMPYFLRQKSKMFRIISFIGRWSMLDIFVIALLISLVDFGFFTSIHVAPASTFFCMAVATTMLAAITFDPRILWDKCSPGSATNNSNTLNQ